MQHTIQIKNCKELLDEKEKILRNPFKRWLPRYRRRVEEIDYKIMLETAKQVGRHIKNCDCSD